MHNFVRNLITEWRSLDLPFSGETFVIALSGGADSVSLFLALNDLRKRNKLDLRFVAAHFNHRLRGAESDADEAFVKKLASDRGMELALGRWEIPAGENLEQSARDARYEFLRGVAENLHAYGVLTAHTMNDQAETFLLNLIRGSGVSGLSGMKIIRCLDERRGDAETLRHGDSETDSDSPDTPLLPFVPSPLLIRPLLRWAKRADTENFCRELEVDHRYDSMNEDLAFRRVRIRKLLIPMLTDFNPKIVETLANTAELMSHMLVRPASSGGFPKGELFGRELILKELKSLTRPDLYRTLREWLAVMRGNLRSLELKHIEAIERLILSPKSGKVVELPGGETVTKQKGKLLFAKIKVDK